jgi:hypothetical protein
VKRSLLALAFVLLTAGSACSGVDSSSKARAETTKASCPAAWRPGWQKLANRIKAPVYCPSWVPSPLDAKIGGRWSSGASVGKDRSYLAGFIWFEKGSEVHINLRGYPGRTAVPKCRNDEQAGGKRVKTYIPCFADAKKPKTVAGYHVTLYTVNRDADQWHLLYAWRRNGSLYTVSEHVAPPFGYQRVVQNLNKMMQSLVLVRPS